MSKLKYFTIGNSLSFLNFSLINSFGIAILFQFFNQSLFHTIGIVIIIRILYLILLAPIAKIIGYVGTKSSIILGVFFLFLSTIALFFLDRNMYFVVFWVVMISLSLSFYSIPHIFFTSKYTSSKSRGSEVSLIFSGVIFATAITPFISGNLISKFSTDGFAIFLSILAVVSVIPFLKLDNFRFSFKHKIGKFLKFNTSLVKASWIETCHFSTRNLNIFWTLYLFLFFDQDFRLFGLILTVITFFSGILNLFSGKLLNQHNRKTILKIQTVFSPFSWIFRILANNTIGIFFADAFHNFNGHLRESAVETTAFDLLNRGNHHEILEEKIVVKEIIINIGVVIVLSMALILAVNFGIRSSFLLGILISLGYLLI